MAQSLEPVVGEVELKPPVWLNALDRVLEAARKLLFTSTSFCMAASWSRAARPRDLAGDLFYLPVALVAFTRFGYLMRRSFFRLMLGDLNNILEGLTELEDKGVTAIDCRRAQFSDKEPIVRLRMICQSWKVMFRQSILRDHRCACWLICGLRSTRLSAEKLNRQPMVKRRPSLRPQPSSQ